MRLLGNRRFYHVKRALLTKSTYKALLNSFLVYQRPFEGLSRYVFRCGEYPVAFGLKTPIGVVNPVLDSYFAMVNVNEVFCREDYAACSNHAKVVVDIGSNIGISALYFLTRSLDSYCYLYEPDPKNINILRKTLKKFEPSYQINQYAVAGQAGRFPFGIEKTGRYGGLLRQVGELVSVDRHPINKQIMVDCLHINDVLEKILSKHDHIDILKLDTEGTEIGTVLAISPTFLPRINKIYLEAKPERTLHPDYFNQQQSGWICALTNKVPS